MEEKSIWREKCGTASNNCCPMGTKRAAVQQAPPPVMVVECKKK